MEDYSILLIVVAIWIVGMLVFLKDYLLGERRVERRRGTPTLEPRSKLRRD
ncbi:MAG: hypothetical protein HUJ24_11235 [Rhodobacteraceae bacterium]|nr:hypothetical protein [Paracoccaceae bacterium]